jgi:AraC-like DNA-binding protein
MRADYEEFAPPPELRPWVAVAWRIRAHESFDLRILPDGCMDIIRDEVIGSLLVPLTARLEAGGEYTGLRLHPGGFPALSGVPASELAGRQLPVRDVLPRFTSLRALAADAQPPDPLVRAASHTRDVRALARASGWSERHLRRRLLAATGHGPKRFMRIARMQRLLIEGRGESWARTAAEHGFFDEAHMANDIRDLAGATPHALLGV